VLDGVLQRLLGDPKQGELLVEGERRLALVRREELQGRREVLEVEQREAVVVAVLEDDREDRGLRLVEVEDPAEEQRSEAVDGRPDLRPELARQRQVLGRMAGRLERPGKRARPLDDLRVGRVAGGRDPCHVAFDVGDEHRNAGLRQLPRQELQALRLAGAGRPRDEAVAGHHRQRDLDADVVGELAVEHRAADDEARLGEAVAGGHLVVECLVQWGRSSTGGRRGEAEAYHCPGGCSNL